MVGDIAEAPASGRSRSRSAGRGGNRSVGKLDYTFLEPDLQIEVGSRLSALYALAMSKKRTVPDAPVPAAPKVLATREVFLDTEAFEGFGFQLDRPELRELFQLADDDRLRLHTTDITMREILGHLIKRAQAVVSTVEDARRSLDHWRSFAPDAIGKPPKKRRHFDPIKMAAERFKAFRARFWFGSDGFHQATAIPAERIFKDWFERRAPFDRDEKEFPDAFALAALAQWCVENKTIMYVVSNDQAMQRAAAASNVLVPIANAQTLLEAAVAAHDPDVEAEAERIAELPDFSNALAAAINGGLENVELKYWGDYGDGELSEPRLVGLPGAIDVTVIAAREGTLGFIVTCEAQLTARLDFEDLSNASFDKEDGVFFNAEHARTEIEDDVSFRLFVEVDATGAISRSEMLTQEIAMREESDVGY